MVFILSCPLPSLPQGAQTMKGNVSREYRLTVFFFRRTLHLKSASDLGMSTGGLSVSAKRHSLSLCALAPLHFHGERLGCRQLIQMGNLF